MKMTTNLSLGKLKMVNRSDSMLLDMHGKLRLSEHNTNVILDTVTTTILRIEEIAVLADTVKKYGLTDTLKAIYPDFEDLETVDNVMLQLEALDAEAISSLTIKIGASYKNTQDGIRNSNSLQQSMVTRIEDRLADIDKIYAPLWKDETKEIEMFKYSVTKFFSNSEATLDQLLDTIKLINNNKYDSANPTVVHVTSEKNNIWIDDITETITKNVMDIDTPKEVVRDAIAVSKKSIKLKVISNKILKELDTTPELSNITSDNKHELVKTLSQCSKQLLTINRVIIKYMSLYNSLLNNLGLKTTNKNKKD